MTRQRTVLMVAALATAMAGCQSLGEPALPSVKSRFLPIDIVCVGDMFRDCPSNDPTVNGHAYLAPDPGRGPLTVKWKNRIASKKTVEHTQTFPVVRRVRYWNEDRLAKREKELGHPPNDPQFRSWMKQHQRDPSTIVLYFLEGGRLAVEIADTSMPACPSPDTQYCPDVGSEE